MRTYLIAYDIADAKRLARVHRYMKRVAVPLQYSVFVTRLTERQLDKVMAALARLINPRQDDVRAYPVPASPEWRWLGAPALPEDVHLLIDPGIDALLAPGGSKG
jgi:CRISPR-associated protein Cas2